MEAGGAKEFTATTSINANVATRDTNVMICSCFTISFNLVWETRQKLPLVLRYQEPEAVRPLVFLRKSSTTMVSTDTDAPLLKTTGFFLLKLCLKIARSTLFTSLSFL